MCSTLNVFRYCPCFHKDLVTSLLGPLTPKVLWAEGEV